MSGERAIVVLAEVMPWLHLKDLASVACTCRALAGSFASLTSLRMKDLARGLERFPVPVLNSSDHVPYPLFSYSPFSILRFPPPLLPWGSQNPSSQFVGERPASPTAELCPCVSSNSRSQNWESSFATNGSQTCIEADSPPLSKRQRQMTPLCGHLLEGALAYNSEFRLHCLNMANKSDESFPSHEFLAIMECGPACGCSLSCKYRVTQQGLSVKVAVYKDQLKGWSLSAMQFIPKGTFVFEYAGELLATLEAQSRQRQYDGLRKIDKGFVPSLLVVREHLPSGNLCLRLNIDATHVGNVARFVNHSCDGGNLQPCIVRLSGCPIPKLAFFARCDIAKGEELTFSYGDEHGSETYRCYCKSAECKGFLPFEET